MFRLTEYMHQLVKPTPVRKRRPGAVKAGYDLEFDAAL